MKFLTHTNPQMGIKINYPSDWEVVENEWQINLGFTAPFEGSSEYRGSLIVDVQDTSEQSISLEDLTELSLDELKKVIGNLKIHEQGAAILAGTKAFRLICSGKQGDFELKWFQTWTIIDNVIYAISYTHGMKFFNAYLEIVEEMVSSLEILDA